jgi:hypothetical protein
MPITDKGAADGKNIRELLNRIRQYVRDTSSVPVLLPHNECLTSPSGALLLDTILTDGVTGRAPFDAGVNWRCALT